MTDTNRLNRLFSADEYKSLKRDDMYKALLHVSPTLAKGQSRATKETLMSLYADAANTDSIPVLEVKADHAEVVTPKHDPHEVVAASIAEVDKDLQVLAKASSHPDVPEGTGTPTPTGRTPSEPQTQYVVKSQDISARREPPTEAQGVQAIIWLQNEEGITESPEEAKAGWEAMSHGQRLNTMAAYRVLRGPDADNAAVPSEEDARATALNMPIDYSGLEVRAFEEHVHGPGCEHDHPPALPGTEGYVRVNPEMPAREMHDGETMFLPQVGDEPMFTFKNGQRDLTAKDQMLINSLDKNYKAFCENASNKLAQKAAEADIYALKTLGIIANPKFMKNMRGARADLRDMRRMRKMGIDLRSLPKSEA